MIHRRGLLAGLAGAAVLGTRTTHAQSYPDRPVRVVVPFPVAQASDIFARRFCDHFHRQFGQGFVVENRAGAGGNIGTASTARAEPDGYTLLWGTNATHAGNEFLYAKLGYDPVKDFEPIAPVLSFGMVFVVPQGSKLQSAEDLIEAGRKEPGKLMVGLPSNTARVVFQLFREKTGADFATLPYPGSGQALTGLLRNDVQLVVDTVPGLLGAMASGQATPIVTATARRSGAIPQTPTLKEKGFDVTLEAWNALLAPRGTPAPILATLRGAVDKALADDALRTRLIQDGTEPLGGSPEALLELMQRDRQIWGRAVRELGIAVQ